MGYFRLGALRVFSLGVRSTGKLQTFVFKLCDRRGVAEVSVPVRVCLLWPKAPWGLGSCKGSKEPVVQGAVMGQLFSRLSESG